MDVRILHHPHVTHRSDRYACMISWIFLQRIGRMSMEVNFMLNIDGVDSRLEDLTWRVSLMCS